VNNQGTALIEGKIRQVTRLPEPSPEFADALWAQIVELDRQKAINLPERQPTFLTRLKALWNRTPPHFQGFRTGVVFTLMLLLAGIILFSTPGGRAMAQSVLSFFTREKSDTLPIPIEYITDPLPTRTPEPPFELALVPAELDIRPDPTKTPIKTQGLSLEEAETLAGFDLYEPSKLPRDYDLTRVDFDSEKQAVYMEFRSPRAGTGEFFYILQGRNLDPYEVGASAKVEYIPIGDNSAEFVQGLWFTPAGSKEALWKNNSDTYAIRWDAENISIEIFFMLNDTFMPAYITRDEMIALAQSLVQCPSSNSDACNGTQVNTSRLPIPSVAEDWMDVYTSVTEIEPLAGFDVLVPGLLPEGVPFSHFRFNPELKMVWIDCGNFAGDLMRVSGPHLRISQRLLTEADKDTIEYYPPEAIEEVEVNGIPGKLYTGSLDWPEGSLDPSTSTPTWLPDTGHLWLTWNIDKVIYSISFDPGYMGGERLSPQNLLRIAESLY